MRTFRRFAEIAATVVVIATPTAPRAQTIGQHGPTGGHLVGSGAAGKISLLAGPVTPGSGGQDRFADVAVDPRGSFAYLAEPGTYECPTSQSGESPLGGGVWVVDLGVLTAPEYAAFISEKLVGRVIEGLQAVELSTAFFGGHVLVTTSEPCGKSPGGVSLIDVSNPLKPVPLAVHFDAKPGPAAPTRSAFAWDAGDHAYVATVPTSGNELVIFDVTNPRRPQTLVRVNVDELGDGIAQPALGLTQSFARDVVARHVDVGGGALEWVLLVSHGDGGFALLDVDDPANPEFMGDTDYTSPDPRLLEATGVELAPEGNAHYAELASDGRFFIGGDEDLAPFAAGAIFNGWGYVHLFDTATRQEIDVFSIPEAHDPDFAAGFGILSVHEVATDPGNPLRSYLSYYSGGLRALEILCFNPSDPSTCELAEVGLYLAASGNDFFGVESFTRGGTTIVLASDRDSGLWVFAAAP